MTSPGEQTEETGSEGSSVAESSGRIARAKARAEEAKRVGADMLAREEAHRFSVRVAVEAFNRDQRFAGGLLAGGLAFRLFLWLLPFSLVVVATLGNVATQLEQPASDLAQQAGLSAALAGTVAKAVDSSDEGRWYLLLVGVLFMLWAGIGVVKALRLISGLAWGVPPKMNLNPLASSAMVFVVAVAIIGAHLLSIGLTGAFTSDLLVLVGESVVLVALTIWVFWNLPHFGEATWLNMIPGGVLVSVGILASRLVTSWFYADRLDRVNDLYGALGVASVFLAWLFILARLWVVGASLNASGHFTPGSPSRAASDG
jgi:uncharacterized BrkB/YihY/UPF0761 family membrane protein